MSSHKLTRSQRDFLELGLLNAEGNPWLQIGIRRGGKLRMAEELKRLGYLDKWNCLTNIAREALRGAA